MCSHTPTTAPVRELGCELKALSDREFEVFELIGRGKTAKEIAHMLGISSKTVDVHRVQHPPEAATFRPIRISFAHAVRWVQANEGGKSV
jgi:FixJ family two-component response regulator